MTLTKCPVCDTLSEGLDKFCTWCGAKLQLDDPYSTSLPPITVTEIPWHSSTTSTTEPQPAKSEPSVTSTCPTPLAVAVDADGNLPICPKCNKIRLIWEKRPVPDWVLPCLVFGVLLIFTCIGAILGLPLWAIGMSGMLQGRKVDPYCPACKQFFQRRS